MKKTKQTKITKRQKFFYIKKEKNESKIIIDIWKFYGTEVEKSERKKLEKKKANL